MKSFHVEIALILLYASLEMLQRHEVRDLGEHEWACVHVIPFPEK